MRCWFVVQKLKIIEEDFCGMDVNTPLGGEKPAVAVSVLNFTTLLTSVAATSAGNYTVAFLGTANGHLKKVHESLLVGCRVEFECLCCV